MHRKRCSSLFEFGSSVQNLRKSIDNLADYLFRRESTEGKVNERERFLTIFLTLILYIFMLAPAEREGRFSFLSLFFLVSVVFLNT